MPSNVKLLAGASGGEPTDANFKNVTLLLHGDGSNGAQNNTFIDSSTNNFTITRNGNTTQGSFSPYGSNWSNYFDGSGDYLTAPDNAALQLDSSNFTIEFWVNFSVVPGASQGATLVSKFDTSNTGYEVILYNNTMYFQAQSASIGMTYAWTPTAGRWYHIAWTRSGSNSYGFIDGALVASTSGASGAITNLAQALQLGRRGDNTLYLNGYLSNVRIVKGTAVYTAAFTPPTQPLTAITNTSLLTCAYNRFRDGSTNNFTITRNGDVKVTNFAPFAPSSAYSTATNGGSAYFDGNGDYLDGPALAGLGGSGNFTIQAWIYPTTVAGDCCIYETRGGSGWVWFINSTGYLQVYDSSATLQTASTTQLKASQWTHIALVKNGSTCTYYVNGASAGTFTLATFQSATRVRIGARNDAAATYFGWISGLKTDGSALTISLPSAPQNPSANTTLLLNATNAAIFDNSMKNDLETVGNAQISTSVKKFGTGSMYFDGTGDYLTVPNNDALNFGTGDFTIEMWMYAQNLASIPMFFHKGASTSTGWFFQTSTTTLYFGQLQGPATTWSVSLSNNTWYHIALTRVGSVLNVFINGVSQGAQTVSGANASIDNTAPLLIGRFVNGSYDFQGYLDEYRITKGVARYTANFTAPTAPFPNK